MMKRIQKRALLGVFAGLVLMMAGTSADAVPTASLHSSNVGIGALSFSFDASTNTITFEETWTSAGIGVVEIDGLDAGVNYTVEKIITNNSGIDWIRLANELLDPAGNDNDNSDVLPYPAFVPAGFTTSNDLDGLSFAQGSGLPRTSSVFSSVLADELTDVRDFLDFFDGTLANGGIDNFMTFGLRDNVGDGENQPFLLVQRPNAFSREPVPEPASLIILGSALIGLSVMRRRRTA